MELIFTKGAHSSDRLEVRRSGGVVETIECPKQRIIPHDMVHFAVESTLSARGFIHRVASGEKADFRMAAEAESDSVERLVEALQSDAWSDGTSPPEDVIALYHVTCSARGCAPLPVDAAAITALRACIAHLDQRWNVVPVGGCLLLTFAI